MRSVFFIGWFLVVGCFAYAQQGPSVRLFKSGELPAAMGRHGSCVIGTRLYVIGGEDNEKRLSETYSAEIHPNGLLGSWRNETPLPEKRAGIQNAMTVVGNRIYIVGGMGALKKGPKPGPVRLDSVIWTEVKADGTLAQWQHAGACPSKRRAGYVVTADETHVFVLGGKGPEPVQDIMSAAVNPDGSLAAWQAAGKMPLPLADHGTVIMDARMYVWGGITALNGPSRHNTRVFSSPISGGVTSQWREETKLTGNAFETVCIGYNDYLLAIGGRDSSLQPSQAIWQARLNQEEVKLWNSVQTDLAGQLFMSAAIDRTRGWVFVGGGKKAVDVDAGAGGSDSEGGAAPKPSDRKYVSAVQAFRLEQPNESKLRIATNTSTGAQTPQASSSASGLMNLPSLAVAQMNAATTKRPVLVLLYSPEVPACKRLWDAVMASPQLAKLQQSAVLAAIDVSAQPAALQKYQVYKVPAVVWVGPDGAKLPGPANVKATENLKQFLQIK